LRVKKKETGFIRIRALVFLIVVGGILYVGFKLLVPFFHFWDLQDIMHQHAKMALMENDETIAKALAEKAKDLGLPLSKEDFLAGIDRSSPGKITIDVHYETELVFPYYRHFLKFHPHVTEVPLPVER